MDPINPNFTVSDYLIQRLHEAGLRDVFTVPGDYVARWFDYMDDKARNVGQQLTRIGCRSELEAGYAADAYGRINGISCAAVTYGVGALSLVNPVAGSYVERVPTVAISGSPGTKSTDRPFAKTYKILLHHATGNYDADRNAYEDITAEAIIISDAKQAPAMIDGALGAALSQKRPVYIEIWRQLWDADCEKPSGPLYVPPLPVEPKSVTAAVTHVASLIKAASKPLFWGGIELQRYGLQDQFGSLIDDTGIPYVTSLLAKSVLAETHAGFIGTYTGPSSDYYTYDTVDKSDLLIVTGDLLTDDYEDILKKDFANMVVAYDGTVRVGEAYYFDIPITDFLTELSAALKPAGKREPWAVKGPVVIGPDNKEFPPNVITYAGFFQRMLDWVSDDMTLVPDESASMYVSCNIPVNRANGFVSEAAWGSIGYASAAALGLSYAAPDARPVVFAGDGGFQMVAQTVSTMAFYKRNPIIFVMANAIYGIEQALTNEKVYTEGQPFNPYNVIPAWDYAALAVAMGAQGVAVSTLTELDAVLEKVKADTGNVWLVQVNLPADDIPEEILRLASGEAPPKPTAVS